MKTFKALLITLLLANTMIVFAQTPELFNYQTVIRDNVGDILANQTVSFRISILETSDTGTSVYTEDHNVTTSNTGLANFKIGDGSIVSGTFNTIDWGADLHFLQIELDDTGGTTYQLIGVTELVSVPYALHSKTAGNVSGLESIDEGNGIGRRLINKPAANYDDIGLNAVDLSHSNSAGTIYGASGGFSTALGRNTIASGNHSTVMGYQTIASGSNSTAMGYYTNALGNHSTAMGRSTEATSLYSTALGWHNVGGGNPAYWVITDPLFEIGNSTSSSAPTNALTILKNGTITAPTFDMSEITDAKALITKEYADANYSGGSGGTASTGLETLDEGNGFGWRLIGINSGFYGDIGLESIDLSISNTASSTYGATGNNAFASGKLTTASGSTSTAMGFFTTATGDFSTATGWASTGLGDFSTAMGLRTNAESYSGFAIGRSNIGGGNSATWVDTDPLFEIGNGNATGSIRSNALTVLKNGTITAPTFDIGEIIDDKALITKEYADINYESTGLKSLDEGNGLGWRLIGKDANNYGSIGPEATDFSSSSSTSSTKGATGNYAFALGRNTTASGNYALAAGFSSNASGNYASAFGSSTLALGNYSTALGLGTDADAYTSLAIGRYNVGGGDATTWVTTDPLFEIGNGNSSNTPTNALTILKNGTITAPTFDIAEITDVKALITKEYADANYVDLTNTPTGLETLNESNGFGWRLVGRNPNFYGDIGLGALDFSTSTTSSTTKGATGNYSAAFGYFTFASGDYSTALGRLTIASGEYSTAFGIETDASGLSSTSMGNQTIASGGHSTAMGRLTIASGNYSSALGYQSNASGDYSSAMGLTTRAQSYGSMAIGKRNVGGGSPNSWVLTDPLFEIGNSESSSGLRTNALTILKNGTITAPTFDISEITDAKALITKEYADANYVDLINDAPTGLKTLDEGNGIGLRLIGYDPINYGNIGEDAVDLSRNYVFSSSKGATGWFSFAAGNETTASGKYSTAMGRYSRATGDHSMAFGRTTEALAEYSTAMGRSTDAESYVSMAMGRYNIGGGSLDTWVSTDPVFEIGNGDNSSNRSNAFTVYKNGNATLAGTLTQNSDRRLKTNISTLQYGLNEILKLNPVAYNWKKYPEQKQKSFGLIAQETQLIIKEVIKVGNDTDKTLSLSYIELIPILIKAMQEQQEIIDSQQNTINELSANETNTNTLLVELLARVKTIENKNEL